MGQILMKDGLKSASTEPGAVYATRDLQRKMPQWCVDNLDCCRMKVRIVFKEEVFITCSQ